MDALNTGAKLQFVLSQLSRLSKKSMHTDYTMVLCPFHNETRPSGRVYHSPTSANPGYFKCYGCGGTAKNWDELAPKLGLESYKKAKPQDAFANLAALTIKASDEEREDPTLPDIKDERIQFKPIPKGSTWRGVSYPTLMLLKAKLCRTYHEEYGWSQPKLYLPVLMKGKRVGYIKALLKKEKGSTAPSYLNAGGKWSKTHGLFPFDQAMALMRKIDSTSIVLVEGPRDAIRLISLGIPALCILGTQSWSKKKALALEVAGIETVILMMDGDCAGIKATELIQPSLKQAFDVKVIKLWKMKNSPYLPFANKKDPSKSAKAAGVTLWDPGNVPAKILDKLKAKYFE